MVFIRIDVGIDSASSRIDFVQMYFKEKVPASMKAMKGIVPM